MAEPSPGELLRAVIDPLHLQVLGVALLGMSSISEVNERYGVPDKRVRLTSVGLIDAEGGVRRDVVRAVVEGSMIRAERVHRRAGGRHLVGDNLRG